MRGEDGRRGKGYRNSRIGRRRTKKEVEKDVVRGQMSGDGGGDEREKGCQGDGKGDGTKGVEKTEREEEQR
ncbi:hypothetical protein AYI69_g2019 [Smittium culicis]|uniref:Uncharacterized protein n=1 Tax=Smittium culicis TaxID=133412 RepID=A0A1R1YNU4_9FUNG|nr:hypothetical protein AYI69_g2019 [Smittium culicis]